MLRYLLHVVSHVVKARSDVISVPTATEEIFILSLHSRTISTSNYGCDLDLQSIKPLTMFTKQLCTSILIIQQNSSMLIKQQRTVTKEIAA